MSDKKVVTLVKGHEPDPDVLEVCRKLLRQAEAGEIIGIAASLDLSKGEQAQALAVGNEWNPGALVLGLGLLIRRIEAVCMDQSEEG